MKINKQPYICKRCKKEIPIDPKHPYSYSIFTKMIAYEGKLYPICKKCTKDYEKMIKVFLEEKE